MSKQKHENPSENLLKKYTLTFKDYVNNALYNPDYGYYIKNAKIGNVANKGDFITLAIDWAPLLAEHFFKIWQGMVEAGEISDKESFHIIEFAAGTGEMALAFLKYLKGNVFNEKKSEWNQFKKVLQYNIIEISPRLVEQQKLRLASFLEEGQVNIRQGDAREASDLLPKKVGIVVSNELIDNFPSHEIQISCLPKMKFSYGLALVVPTVSQTKNNSEQNSLNIAKQLGLAESDLAQLKKENRRICSLEEMEKYLQSNEDRNKIKMIKFHVEIEQLHSSGMLNDSEHSYIKSVLSAALPLLKKKLNIGDTKPIYLQPDIQKYYENIRKILTKGYVFTLDYGSNALFYFDLKERIRTYSENHITPTKGKGRTAKSPLIFIGEQDITFDVNFSNLDLEGKALGFQTEYFGTQDSLGGVYSDGFQVLIQSYQLPSNSRSKVNDFLLSRMQKPLPIAYKDMPAFYTQFEQGKLLLNELEAISYCETFFAGTSDLDLFGARQIKDAEDILNNSPPLLKAFKDYLDWLKKIDYLHTNYAQLTMLELSFFKFFIARADNFFKTLSQKLDLNEANIIILMLIHQLVELIAVETKKFCGTEIEKTIFNFWKQLKDRHPDLINPYDCENSYYQFNMLPHPKLDPECTQLKLSFRVAELLADHKELDDLKTAEDWKNLGNRFFTDKQFSKALLCFDIALKLSPQYKEAALNKGLCHKNLKENAKALAAFRYALEIDPSYSKAMFNIMNILSGQKKNEEALKEYETAKVNFQKDESGLKCEELAKTIYEKSKANRNAANSSSGMFGGMQTSNLVQRESPKNNSQRMSVNK